MATADNFLNMTQNFMTPDILQKFSGVLGQPVEKIQSGLKSVLPTFLMGIVNKGTTKEGAQSLVNMVQREEFDSSAAPSNLNDAAYLKKGSEAVSGIFGNDLNTVTSSLSSSTGMNSSSVTKMLGLIAPMVMGALGSKIRREGMNASKLSGFLSQQKSNLAGFLPSGLSNLFGGNAHAASSTRDTTYASGERPAKSYAKSDYHQRDSHYRDRKPWALLGLALLLLLGVFWWMSARRNAMDAARTVPVTTSRTTIIKAPVTTTTQFTEAAPALSEMDAFLTAGDESALPKRFAFQSLTFETATANIDAGAMAEVDQIATALTNYPEATARIEGFTDNTGNAAANIDLSNARAQAVKAELVNRGISAERIEAIGRGSESPVASNEDEAGRALNRRIEFVLTNIK